MNGGGSSTTFTDVSATGTFNGLKFTTSADLSTGQTYKFKIVSTNAVGDSAASPESIAMMAAIIPTAP